MTTKTQPPRRGRPPVAKGGKRIAVRLDAPTVAALTEWRRSRPDLPDESTAARLLLQRSLGTTK